MKKDLKTAKDTSKTFLKRSFLFFLILEIFIFLKNQIRIEASDLILTKETSTQPSNKPSTLPSKAEPIWSRLKCKHIKPITSRYLRYHINLPKEDTDFENRIIHQFIKKIDPMKMYFIKDDVHQIKTSMKGILSRIKKKDCSSIKKAHDIFKKRVKERLTFSRTYLNTQFKLDKNTELILDPDFRDYIQSDQSNLNSISQKTLPQEALKKNTPKKTIAKKIDLKKTALKKTALEKVNDYYRKYIQFQVSSYTMNGESLKEAKQYVLRQYERLLREVNKISDSELWALFLNAYSGALDPHSGYFSVSDLEEFEIRMRLSLEGIGTNLSYRDGFTVVEEILPGGAASRSGLLQIKDKIISVAQGEDGKFENVIEMPLRDVVRKIRGAKGTKVRLTLLRKGEGGEVKRINITLVRDQIKLEEEAVSMLNIERKTGPKKKRKVALITLNSFYADNRKGGRSASSDFKMLLRKVKKEKVDALVLDLSLNRGGTLEDAVKISGLFLKTGNIVKQSQRFPSPYILLADEDSSVDYSGPLVVLVDRVSASASEIVAGALQDYNRAVIVGGEHTFGKGSVQSVELLSRGFGAIKTTVGMFFIPSGKSTQRIGVSADITFPSVFSSEIGEKTLDYSLKPKEIPSFVSKQAYVKKGSSSWKVIHKDIIRRLKEKSTLRISKNEDFKKIVENSHKAKKRKKIIRISDFFDKEKGKDEDKKEEVSPLNPKSKKRISKKGKEGEKGEKKKPALLSQKEKKKENYLKRADIQEAINVAFDLVDELFPALQMAVKSPPVQSEKPL